MERLTDKHTRIWIALMNFGSRLGCHQMEDRSFFYKGYQFPVCARCTGVIIGEVISLILILCGIKINYLYAILLSIPLVVDGGLQYINIWKSNNLRRIITGILAGFGLTYIYLYALSLIWHILTKLFETIQNSAV